MIEEKLVCLEMDDASGRDKRKGWAKLEDWMAYRDLLRGLGAFVAIAIEPQKADPEVMRFLAQNRDQFLPSVHVTVKYGHYGGQKTKAQIREMWEWTVREIQKFGFDMGMDSNGFFIPPMHMISDNAIDVLRDRGVKSIGSETANFPLGARDVKNGKGEQVYALAKHVEPYTPYRGVHFYRRFRPWVMSADLHTTQQILDAVESNRERSAHPRMNDGSFGTYLDLCVRDFREKCWGRDATFYAHEINLGGERPFIGVLERLARAGLFSGIKFVDPLSFTQYHSADTAR